MLNKVKAVTTRKAKEATQQMLNIGSQISEGVQKVKQRIIGRSGYEPVSTHESRIEPENDHPMLSKEYFTGNQEQKDAILSEYKNSVKIKNMNKIKQNLLSGDDPHNLIYGIDPLDFEAITQRDQAALRIQTAMRNREAKQVVKTKTEMKKATKPLPLPTTHELDKSGVTPLEYAMNQNKQQQSATKIQTAMRNKAAKQVVKTKTDMMKAIKPLPLPTTHELDKSGVTPLEYAMNQNKQQSATKIQSAMRNKTAKRDMMKQRQTVREVELKQLEAIKQGKINDNAAQLLQSASKRVAAQGKIKDIKGSKDKIDAVVKRLLTEQVRSDYSPTIKKTMIWNKNTVGQELAYSDRSKKLVSKKKRDAGLEGSQNRAAFLDVAEQYSSIMKKKK